MKNGQVYEPQKRTPGLSLFSGHAGRRPWISPQKNRPRRKTAEVFKIFKHVPIFMPKTTQSFWRSQIFFFIFSTSRPIDPVIGRGAVRFFPEIAFPINPGMSPAKKVFAPLTSLAGHFTIKRDARIRVLWFDFIPKVLRVLGRMLSKNQLVSQVVSP